VAAFGDADRSRLMADPGIVRNARKVDAAIVNARAVLDLRDEGGLDAYLWSFAPEHHQPPRSPAELRATSSESVALAAGLKGRGFIFVGPTTAYAAMQACGLVDDHLAGCFRAAAT
jgi:DNA-3-methyladenine glycosylase I